MNKNMCQCNERVLLNRSVIIRTAALCRSVAQLNKNVTNYLDALGGHMLLVPRADDIYVVSYPRSGTTWLQMILYQIMTDGDLNFGHISERVPFFERSLTVGRDLNALPSPRLFKTHYPYDRLPRFG